MDMILGSSRLKKPSPLWQLSRETCLMLRDKHVIVTPFDFRHGATRSMNLNEIDSNFLRITRLDVLHCARMTYVDERGCVILKDRWPRIYYPTLKLETLFRRDYLNYEI